MVNRGKKMVPVTDFLILGSKITVDDDCSHEIKRRLLLGRKVMTNLDSILIVCSGQVQSDCLGWELAVSE